MWPSKPPRDLPPPFMANAILNFHFDFLTPSLRWAARTIFSIIDPLMTFCKSFLVLQCNYNREISQNFNLVVTDQSHSANFRPISLKRIEPRVLISEPLFYPRPGYSCPPDFSECVQPGVSI